MNRLREWGTVPLALVLLGTLGCGGTRETTERETVQVETEEAARPTAVNEGQVATAGKPVERAVPYEGPLPPGDPPMPPLSPMQKPVAPWVKEALDVWWERPSPKGPPPIPRIGHGLQHTLEHLRKGEVAPALSPQDSPRMAQNPPPPTMPDTGIFDGYAVDLICLRKYPVGEYAERAPSHTPVPVPSKGTASRAGSASWTKRAA